MRFLNYEELKDKKISIGRVTLNKMVTRGEFPAPLQVAGRLVFDESEVDAWLAARPRGLYPQAESLKRHQERNREVSNGK